MARHFASLKKRGARPVRTLASMIIERRTFLELPLAVAGAWLLGCKRDRPLTFDELAEAMGALARALREAEPRDEEAYVERVAALAARLGEVPTPKFGKLFKDTVATSLAYRGSWLALVQWRMEPDRRYPAHDHPSYNQVTLGVEGECRLRHYQIVGAAPPRTSAAPFEVRRTQDNVLRPGGVTSIFTTRRDNIHELETGPAGARGIDLMTLVGKHEGFSFLDIAREPTPGGVHRATWGEHLRG